MVTKKQENVENQKELSPQAKELLAALDITKKELEDISSEIDAFKAEKGLGSKKPLPRRREVRVFEQEVKLEDPKIIYPFEVKVDEKQYDNLKKVEARALKRKAKELEN